MVFPVKNIQFRKKNIYIYIYPRSLPKFSAPHHLGQGDENMATLQVLDQRTLGISERFGEFSLIFCKKYQTNGLKPEPFAFLCIFFWSPLGWVWRFLFGQVPTFTTSGFYTLPFRRLTWTRWITNTPVYSKKVHIFCFFLQLFTSVLRRSQNVFIN